MTAMIATKKTTEGHGLLVTKEEAIAHYHQCVQITARRMGLKDIDWKGTDELLQELMGMERDAMTYRVLLGYLNAYRAWHDYHVWIETNGKSGRLDDHEKARLRGLITERDAKRRSIIMHLDSVAPQG